LWKKFQICDACRIAPANTDSKSEFFLCDRCDPAVVIEFCQFELPREAARRATLSGRHTSGLTKPLDRTEAWPNQG
jgi:hypothetical protein